MTNPVPSNRNRSRNPRRKQSLSGTPVVSDTHPVDEYRVGPGRPPRAFQFKPGQSGNPKGAKHKAPSLAPDLKALLQAALSKTIKVRRGEREEIVSKAAAGIERLVNQFTKGNWHARRDLIVLAEKLGVDLTAGHSKAIEGAIAEVVSAEDEALLADYVRRHAGRQTRRRDRTVRCVPKSTRSEKPGLPTLEE